MSGPFISPRAIKIINLIITTVMVSYESWVITSLCITSLWWVIIYLLDFFFINSIRRFLFFLFLLNFSFECDVVKKNESSLTRIFPRNAHASYSSFSAPFVSTNQNRVFRYGRHPGWMRRRNQRKRNWRFPEGRNYDSLKWLILVTHNILVTHRSESSNHGYRTWLLWGQN